MAKVKPKRHGVLTDMTAMCDVTFLLLTFFILTTEFKQPDVENIVTPSSVSKSKLTEAANTMTISVTNDGRYYFTPTSDPEHRKKLLEAMGEKNKITFTDKEKNPNNAQLIFTTHNTIYMDMDLLRRDEIWFVEKDNGVSNLYSLDDITNEKGEKVRKDSNYEKHYLLGNYGAIPNLKNLLGRE